MSSRREIEVAVRTRAGDRCEYCKMHQNLQGASFHVEHIVPRARGGTSDIENLALACPGCNLHKADRVDAVDPTTGQMARLFHPRRDASSDHFAWNGYDIQALSKIGRARSMHLT